MQKYFMGASTKDGYETSFYDEHKDYYGYFLKGGPGTGKSTLMKKLVKEFSNENISVYYCSSDPNSIDAVVLEDRHIFIADATSPHAADTKLPYVTGECLDLAVSLDAKMLWCKKTEISELCEKNQACHKIVKKYLSQISSIQENIIEFGKDSVNKSELKKYSVRFNDEYIGMRLSKSGTMAHRQRISHTPFGKKWLLPDDCRLIVLKDDCLYAANYILDSFKTISLSSGYNVEETRSVTQRSYPESMLFIPELKIAVCGEQNLQKNMTEKATAVIELKFLYNQIMNEEDDFIKLCARNIAEMEDMVSSVLSEALKIHDDLEVFYINAIDMMWLDNKFTELKNKISSQS